MLETAPNNQNTCTHEKIPNIELRYRDKVFNTFLTHAYTWSVFMECLKAKQH